MTQTILREFSSWPQFTTSANDPSLFAWTRTQKKSSHEKDHDRDPWHGTLDFSTAIEMATQTGWPEGRTLLHDSLTAALPRPTYFPSLEFSVAGAFPLIPLFAAGDPECMVTDPGSILRSAQPIVRIDYNNWISSSVTPRDMILRGAAVLSFANSLEQRGQQTELRIVGNSQANNQTFRISIIYKPAGETLDLDRAAFAIAHPASLRRLAFAIMEQHPKLESNFCHGYGRPLHEPNDPKPSTVFVPGSRGHETPTSARLAVELAAQQAGLITPDSEQET